MTAADVLRNYHIVLLGDRATGLVRFIESRLFRVENSCQTQWHLSQGYLLQNEDCLAPYAMEVTSEDSAGILTLSLVNLVKG